MAETGVLDRDSEVAEPEPEEVTPKKRSAGRPKGAENKDVEIPVEEFSSILANLTDADWSKGHIIYVYRSDPFYDNTNGGRSPKYIAVETQPISEESLKQEYGSGTYKIQLNKGDKKVALTIWSILDPKFPPHLPPGDWLEHPRNKKWVSWKPAVNKWWADKMRDATGPTQGSGDGVPPYMVQFMNDVRNEVRHAEPSKKDDITASIISVLPALLQQANTAQDPAKMITALRDAKEFLAPAVVPVVKEDNGMMQFVLAQLTRLQESNDKLMGIILTQKNEAAKPADPLNQVETMIKLVGAVSGIVQPAAAREPWQDVVSDLGPKVLDLGQQFIMSRTQETMARTRALEAQRRNSAPATQPVNQPSQPTTEAQPVNAEVIPPEEIDTMQRGLLINIATLAKSALDLGLTGDAFADQMCFKFGQANYDMFIKAIPKDQLIQKFQAVPEAWKEISPFEPILQEFIDQFYAFAEDEPEPTPEPVVIDVPKPKTKKVKK